MFNEEVVERRIQKLSSDLPFKPKRFSIEQSIDIQNHLINQWDGEKNKLKRDLVEWEEQFILNELFLSKWDFNYWAPRYAFLNTKTGETCRINFWESQLIALKHIANGELEAWKRGGDNLWAWLKARQLGATQIAEMIIGHRLFFHYNQRAVIASDDPNNSTRLSRRVEFIYNHLPFWMKPHLSEKVKGVEMLFDLMNSYLYIGHGNMDPTSGGIGQGETCNIFHLTEIPDWKNWQQIEEDFLPTVPLHPSSIGFCESTARRRNDHWHDMFDLAWKGKSRFKALFIPYYAEEHTYKIEPPDFWEPSIITLAHAQKVAEQSPLYCFGKSVKLSKGQLYWWERTYEEYKAKGRVHVFYQEYASDHLEAFQNSSVGLWSSELLGEALRLARPFNVMEVISQ